MQFTVYTIQAHVRYDIARELRSVYAVVLHNSMYASRLHLNTVLKGCCMLTVWILMYALNSGGVVVYNVYTSAAECMAVASTLKYNVESGVVECAEIVLEEKTES